MQQLTAILHRGEPNDGGFWATCLEVPGANGQGETQEECLRDLATAVRLILKLSEEEAAPHFSAIGAAETPDPYCSLRDTPIVFRSPIEPVADGDWEADGNRT